ncbi:MAG: host attachment protein, partial [Deltaproteobacteria bacterium]
KGATMKIKAGMWVVVADGARGLVLVNEGNAMEPSLKVVRVYEQDNPKTSEQGRDKPPRAFSSVGEHRSAIAENDLHRRAEDRFVDQIVADLAKDSEAGRFDDLVVVAPPVALGEMRKAAGGALARKIVATLDKDLTGHTVPDITAAVARALEG